MNPQEKLEAMFCPRLDSALVASIYHDMGDFAACIPILSALAKAAFSEDEQDQDDDDDVVAGGAGSLRNNPQSPSGNSKKQNGKAAGPAKKKANGQSSTSMTATTTNAPTTNTKARNNNNNNSKKSKANTPDDREVTTSHEEVAPHPLKEKILLWTENVAASQSDLGSSLSTVPNNSNKTSTSFSTAVASSSSSSSSSTSGVQYLPSSASVQPVSAPAGFKGFKTTNTQIVTRTALGSTLPSASTGPGASAASNATTDTGAPGARLKAVRNPNFQRQVAPIEMVESSSDEEEEEGEEGEEEEEEEDEDQQSVSNSDKASTSTTSASATVTTTTAKKKNRRSGRGKKDKKKREALRAQAAAANSASAVEFSSFSTLPPLKSWKKDRGGGGGGGGGGEGRWHQQKQKEMDEMAALLDSATRLSSVQLHRQRQQIMEPQGAEDEDEDDDDDDDNEAEEEADGSTQTLDSKRREQVAFLRSCFPDKDHSSAYLAECLKESQWDIEAAVELILSRMFLENEQVETSSSGSNLSAQSRATTDSWTTTISTSSQGANDDLWMHGTKKGGQKQRGTNKAQNRRILLHSATGGTETTTSGSDTLSNTLTGQDALWLLQQSSGSGNDWAAFENQIQILMTTFYLLPRKTIVATFHEQGANLIRTIEALEVRQREQALQGGRSDRWNSSRQEALIEASHQFDTKLAQLVEMFPGHAVSGLKKFLVYSQGNVQEAMNAVLAAGFADEDLRPSPLAAAAASNNSNTTTTTEYVPLPVDIRYKNDRNGTPVPTGLLTEAKGQGGWSRSSLAQLPSTTNPFPQGVRRFENTLLDKSNAELYNDEDDPVWCRQQAHDVLQQRNELFRKAAKAYQHAKGKGVGMGGIAAYYADEGKKLDAMGKRWHMRAARAVVQQHRLENNDVNLVDLHGLTISEAQTVVREAVTEWFARSTMQANRIAARPLRIVTGVGSHSKDRIARLYPSILSMLQKDGWRVETESGVILVKGVARLVTSNRK
ncbi:hypothetical protein BGZ73_000001 [Actinomortierella ambigua]|nr:hypothetical protein BGZ73_000001 [Actinomortierella ambigua]